MAGVTFLINMSYNINRDWDIKMDEIYLRTQNNSALPQLTSPAVRIAGGQTAAIEETGKPVTITAGEYQPNDFADAIYAGTSYSLLHPNVTSDILAQNTDILA